jgi:hypothetical protein
MHQEVSWLDEEKVNWDYDFIRRERRSVLYSQIDGVSMSQSPLGKIFGYGKLKLERKGMKDFYILSAPCAEELYDFFVEIERRNKARERN